MSLILNKVIQVVIRNRINLQFTINAANDCIQVTNLNQILQDISRALNALYSLIKRKSLNQMVIFINNKKSQQPEVYPITFHNISSDNSFKEVQQSTLRRYFVFSDLKLDFPKVRTLQQSKILQKSQQLKLFTQRLFSHMERRNPFQSIQNISNQQKQIKNSQQPIKKQEVLGNLKQSLLLINNSKCNPQSIIPGLLKMQQRLPKQNTNNIKRLIALTFGKLIVRDQINKRNQLLQKNKQKKKQTLDSSRWHQIKICQYPEIQKTKIKQKIFIFRPHNNFKGFNPQSNSFKNVYPLTLKYIQSESMLRHINDICYQSSYDALVHDRKAKSRIFFVIFNYIFLLLLLVLLILAFGYSENQVCCSVIYAILVLFGMYGTYLCVQSVCKVFAKHDNLTETQRLILKIRKVFQNNMQLTNKDTRKHLKYFWTCPDHYLWIEVKILGNFLEEQEDSDRIYVSAPSVI